MIAKYVTKYFLLLNIDFVPYYACVYKIHKYKQSFQYGTRVVRSSVAYFVFNSLLGHYFVTPSNPMQAFLLLGNHPALLASVHFKPFFSPAATIASEHLFSWQPLQFPDISFCSLGVAACFSIFCSH